MTKQPNIEGTKYDTATVRNSVSNLASAIYITKQATKEASFMTGGKSRYSIQLSNYITRLNSRISTDKGYEKFVQSYGNDPMLSSLPIFKKIKDGTASIPEFAVFRAYSEHSKSKDNEYGDMTTAELERALFWAFENSSHKSEGWVKLGIPADSTELPIAKVTKLSRTEILDNFVEIAQGEIAKMKMLRALPADSLLHQVGNYVEKASKEFTILPFLNKSITDITKVNPTFLKEVIKDYLENEFLEEERIAAAKEGILDSEIVDGQTEYTMNSEMGDITQLGGIFAYETFLLNQFYRTAELTTLIAKDSAYYKDSVDLQKRFKTSNWCY